MSLALSTTPATPLRIPTYFSKHPMRSPSWKWERAIGIANGTQPKTTRRFDGEAAYGWIKRAVKFYRGLKNARTMSELSRVSEQYADIYWAHFIFESPYDLRAIVDSHILARVDPTKIAKKVRQSLATIEAYEELFFDVRSSLDNEFYILYAVLGHNLQTLKPDIDYTVLWKCYGYYAGPHVLRVLISKFAPGCWCDDEDKVSSGVQDDMLSIMKLKTSIAVKTIPVNGRTQLGLLNAFIKFVEVEKNSESQEASTQLLLSGVEEMYTSMRINIGGRDPAAGYNAIDTGLVGIYDKGGVELRCDELMDVAGGVIPLAAKSQANFPRLTGN
jgi:hypothetical protein